MTRATITPDGPGAIQARWQHDPGKGGKGRSVAMTATLASQLKAWRRVQKETRLAASWWSEEPDPWLMSTDIGTRMDAHNFRKKDFGPVAAKVAPGVTPH